MFCTKSLPAAIFWKHAFRANVLQKCTVELRMSLYGKVSSNMRFFFSLFCRVPEEHVVLTHFWPSL